MSERTTLRAAISKLVPRTWQIIDTDRQIDHVKTAAVLISQRTIAPAPNAAGTHIVTFRVYVVAATDAEDALDDKVDTLLYAIDKIEAIRWTLANKVIYQDRTAYELTIEAFTERKD